LHDIVNGVFSKFETDIDTDQKEKAGPFDPAWNKYGKMTIYRLAR